LGRHRLASKICACARAQPPRVAHGLNSHTACAIGGWSRGRAPPGPKKSKTGLRRFSPASTNTARKLEGLSFRAAIGDRQAVYRWLLGHELSFQAKSLADLGRGRRSIEPSLRSRTAAASLACSAPRVLHPSEEPHHRLAPAAVGLEEQHQQVRVRARRTDADGAWA